MILVTGATGNVGTALLRQLAETADVRAVAHTAASRDAIERLGIEAVDGDFDDVESVEKALVGCDQLFLLSPPFPDQVAREKAAIDAAAASGVQRVVALSVMGSGRSSDIRICRWHGEIDDHIDASGLEYTILRPAGFMQVHMMPVDMVRQAGAWFGMTGDGVAAYIDSEDVAAVAAALLISPQPGNRVYDLTGPEAITMAEGAAQLSEAIGRAVPYVEMPPDQFHMSMLSAGLPPWLADAGVELYEGVRDGVLATVTDTVEELTGKPPRTYREFLASRRDAFCSP